MYQLTETTKPVGVIDNRLSCWHIRQHGSPTNFPEMLGCSDRAGHSQLAHSMPSLNLFINESVLPSEAGVAVAHASADRKSDAA